MIQVKNCLSVVLTLCFMTSSLWAEEGSKTVVSGQQKKSIPQEQVRPEDQPMISFDATTYEAGEVREGDTINHAFKVKNTGTAPLEIKQVKPG